MADKTKLEKVAKDADLVTEHKQSGQGRPAGAKGAAPALKTMSKPDLMRELGASRKKIKEFEGKLADFTKGGTPKEDQIPPEMWAVFPALVYDYMATRFGPHWKLNEEEVLLYGQNIGKVADRYLGTVAGENPELFSLAIVAVSVTVPRVIITFKQRGKDKDAALGKEANGNNNGPRSKGVGEKQLGPKSPA